MCPSISVCNNIDCYSKWNYTGERRAPEREGGEGNKKGQLGVGERQSITSCLCMLDL